MGFDFFTKNVFYYVKNRKICPIVFFCFIYPKKQDCDARQLPVVAGGALNLCPGS